ncbi:uncharacterized protein LOC135126520 isoform X2 [Zophobas morio]|uniref:uncharacterized protein LOC135126520 isoform X2 n=1 Tax=Zophobas morio TaxID=2755281 RepID=UPI0030836B60
MKLLFLFIISSVTFTTANKYDVEAEITEKLEDLKSTVQGTISVAFITNLVKDFTSYRTSMIYSSASALGQQSQTFRNRINNLKMSAQYAGKNIDVCLSTNEPLLNKLANDASTQLNECVIVADSEMAIIEKDTNYRVDTLMNEVHKLEFQLDICANDLLCQASVTTDIETSMLSIPQKIGVEVDQAVILSDELKVQIKPCMDPKVAQYSLEAGAVASEITRCVNNILSS